MNSVEKKVYDLTKEIVERNGAILDSVEQVKENDTWFLRLLIDAENGVNIDMCTNISNEVALIAEIDDLFSSEYILEVSSLGIERELRTVDEQIRFIGEYVHVILKSQINQMLEFEGYLVSANEEEFSVQVNLKGRKKVFTFSQGDLKFIRLAIKF